jgi:hypothetical protein
MKETEELFGKYTYPQYKERADEPIYITNLESFKEALAEHDKEIIAEIDEMIEKKQKLLTSIRQSEFKDIEAENIYLAKIGVLTELKSKIGE